MINVCLHDKRVPAWITESKGYKMGTCMGDIPDTIYTTENFLFTKALEALFPAF
jgi:hypothetical protein